MSENAKLETALAILAAIIEMSDRVEAAGGCMCISGIAAANQMQKSIQKNKPRIVQLAKELSA